jgi:hypothetical protein
MRPTKTVERKDAAVAPKQLILQAFWARHFPGLMINLSVVRGDRIYRTTIVNQSETMEPTELYNHSKRNLVIFAAVLALALFGVVKVEGTVNQFGLTVVPNAVPTVLFFVVVYLLYQFVLASTFQHDDVRRRTRIDFASTAGFSSFVLLGYLGRTQPV